MGPVLPMALRIKATIKMPPVSPKEKLNESEKERLSLPNKMPKTMPAAMGKNLYPTIVSHRYQ
jgi:hypothetical protein